MIRITLILALIASTLTSHAQLTIEGRITGTAEGLKLYLADADGHAVPIGIKGKRKPRYKVVIDSRNSTYCLVVWRKGHGKRHLHIFTHQPDGRQVRWWHWLDLPAGIPEESVLYWSPSQRNYIHTLGITAADVLLLGELQLRPTRVHPSIIQINP